MKLSENAEEILELLWTVTEEEGKEGLKETSVPAGDVAPLVRHGFVEWRNGRLALTDAGRPQAEQAVRRHRLAERLLVDVLVTEDAQVDDQACRFEHLLTNGVEESICTLLGHPEFCPHGKPIPRGKCCEAMKASIEQLIAPLSELDPDQHGEIAYIRMDNPKRLQKLMAMGVLPGVGIQLRRRFPTYVFEIGNSQFAVDETIAGDIYVRLAP